MSSDRGPEDPAAPVPVRHADEPEAAGAGTGLTIAAWSAVATVLLVIQWIAPEGPARTELDGGIFAGWNHFDGPEYLRIALHGYRARALVWFPLYPLLIRAVDAVLGDALLSAVLVSLVAGLCASVLLWKWLATTTMSRQARTIAVAVVLVYPYGWYLYGVVYADALFLALCLGSFVCFERDRRGWAAAIAALATATRPAGYAVVVGLLVLSLERDGVLAVDGRARGWVRDLRLPLAVRLGRLRAGTALPLWGLGGLGLYAGYQWRSWGSPWEWMVQQRNYHSAGTASLLKQQYFAAFTQGFDGRHLATTTLQAILLALVIASVPGVGRRFGWGYGAFVFCLALLPAVSVSTFMGVGRYLIPSFPAFALLAERLEGRRLARWAVPGVSACLLLVMAAGFSRSWYLA